jgi:hypothetical protein
MTVTSNDRGQQNMWAKEPEMIVTDHPYGVPHNERAELLNGRVCMIGFTIGMISYILTGTLGFGFF